MGNLEKYQIIYLIVFFKDEFTNLGVVVNSHLYKVQRVVGLEDELLPPVPVGDHHSQPLVWKKTY